jgi:hypothetical protein
MTSARLPRNSQLGSWAKVSSKNQRTYTNLAETNETNNQEPCDPYDPGSPLQSLVDRIQISSNSTWNILANLPTIMLMLNGKLDQTAKP